MSEEYYTNKILVYAAVIAFAVLVAYLSGTI